MGNDMSEEKKISCNGCKSDIKKPYGVPFECVDGHTYCAACFVDRSINGPKTR